MSANHVLTVLVDRERRLAVLDPTGRQMVLSCGCALFNARVSAASDGYRAIVRRFPDGPDSDVLACIRLERRTEPPAGVDIDGLDAAIFSRRTNRRPFSGDPVPPDVVERLVTSAAEEGAALLEVRRVEHRAALARLTQQADRTQSADRAYRAELREWLTADPDRMDGVSVDAVPRVDGSTEDEIPIRDFDAFGLGRLPAQSRSTAQQCLLLLGTYSDTPEAWLRAGEALERVLLEVTRLGYAVSPLTQVVEVPQTRDALRTELELNMYPHVLLRVGRATMTPPSRRRPFNEVFVEQP